MHETQRHRLYHWIYIYIYIYIYISKVGDRSRRRPEGSLFNSPLLLLSLDCSTLPLIHTFYCRVLSKEVSSTIFKVFGMTWPGIEPRFPGRLANTLPTRPMHIYVYVCVCVRASGCKFFLFFSFGSKREKSKNLKMNRSTKLYSLKNYLFISYTRFQLVAFVRELFMIFPFWCSAYIEPIPTMKLKETTTLSTLWPLYKPNITTEKSLKVLLRKP